MSISEMSTTPTSQVDVVLSSRKSDLMLTLSRGNFKQSVALRRRMEASPLPLKVISGSLEERSENHAVISLALVDLKIGVIWGDEVWSPSLSRSLAVDGCDFLIYWEPSGPRQMEDEFWWVRTYENVIPSLRMRFMNGVWDVSSAGPNGMVKHSAEIRAEVQSIVRLELSETELERSRRPYLSDMSVPLDPSPQLDSNSNT